MLLIVWFALQAPALFGSMISSHVGSADPISEGFLALNPAGTAVANDGGHAAWQLTPSYTTWYYHQLTEDERDAALLAGWTVQGRMRLPSPVESEQTGAFLNIDFGGLRFDINLYIQGGTLFVRNNTSVVSEIVGGVKHTTVDGIVRELEGSASNYHFYEMVYDPLLHTATLRVDGVVLIEGYSGHANYSVGYGLWFGAYQQPVNMSLAQFSIHDSNPGQYTPEPATEALFCAGIAALVALRARRR